jgi:hypothetical protein
MRWNTRAGESARNSQYENDRSLVSTIVKGVKWATASEYSREFSAKVFNGQSRLIELGFRQGGPAGYGWSFCALQVRDWDYHAHAEPMLGDEAKVIRLYFLNEADAEAFQRRWD